MIYLASPFFNEEQLNFVKQIENKLIENNLVFFSPRRCGILKNMSAEERAARMADIFAVNINQIENSDCIVAVIDDRDPGTIFEIGFAFGLNISIFTITAKNYGINVMLKYATNDHFSNIDDLIEALKGNDAENAEFEEVY